MNWYRFIKFAVSQNIADKLQKWLEANKLEQFPQLFGENDRIVLPFVNKPMTLIMNMLEQRGYSIDISRQMAYKKVKTNFGEKLQPIKISKAIQKELGEDTLRLWNEEGGFWSIVISRKPIDVVRMSDFKGIQSCHSEGGSYFKCAVAEALGYGAVAFLVPTKDVKSVPDLQSEEIFEDRKRKVPGIVPTSRIRLRRFINEDKGYDLAIPERHTYGNSIDDFRDELMKFVWEKQKEMTDNGKDLSDLNNFHRAGGSYQDTESKKLFFDYLTYGGIKGSDMKFKGNIEYRGEDDYESVVQQYEQEIEEFKEAIPLKYSYIEANVEIEGDENNFVMMYVFGGINFEYDLGKEFSDVSKDDSSLILLERKLEANYREIKKVIHEIPSSGLYSDIDDIGWDFRNGKLVFRVKLSFEMEQDTPDAYKAERMDLKDFEEKKYIYLYAKIGDILASYIKLPIKEHPYYQALNKQLIFKYLSVENSDYHLRIETAKISLGTSETSFNDYEIELAIKQFLSSEITRIYQSVQQSQSQQMYFELFRKPEIKNVSNIVPEIWFYNVDKTIPQIKIGFELSVVNSIEDFNNKMEFLKVLDEYLPKLVVGIQNVFAQKMKETIEMKKKMGVQ